MKDYCWSNFFFFSFFSTSIISEKLCAHFSRPTLANSYGYIFAFELKQQGKKKI